MIYMIIAPPHLYPKNQSDSCLFCLSVKSSIPNVPYLILFWALTLYLFFREQFWWSPQLNWKIIMMHLCICARLLMCPVYQLAQIISFTPPNDTNTFEQTSSDHYCFILLILAPNRFFCFSSLLWVRLESGQCVGEHWRVTELQVLLDSGWLHLRTINYLRQLPQKIFTRSNSQVGQKDSDGTQVHFRIFTDLTFYLTLSC